MEEVDELVEKTGDGEGDLVLLEDGGEVPVDGTKVEVIAERVDVELCGEELDEFVEKRARCLAVAGAVA